MTLPAEKRPDENDFAEQVLRRVAKVEKKRRWSSRVRFLVPIVVMAVVVGAWSNAFFDGTLVLHWLIQVLAWVTVVATVEAHWDGIIAWQQSRLSNGLLEGTNSLVQAAKRRARGYRSKSKMITIIYLIAGKLPLPQIHTI